MVTGWRRAFCTSFPKEGETRICTEKKQPPQQCNATATASTVGGARCGNQSPRISSKFGFFSNPSTPRSQSQSQPVSSSTPNLRCRTAKTPTSSVPNSPKLHCKKSIFYFSNPSPKSPSSFSLPFLKSKSRCGICLQSVKSGQGTAILTAECNHMFHFPCITSHVKNKHHQHYLLICPVCNANWKQLPLISIHPDQEFQKLQNEKLSAYPKMVNLRVYNDDEPLLSPSPAALFHPIPEIDSEDDPDTNDISVHQEFQGFFVDQPVLNCVNHKRHVGVTLSPESAIVTVGRSCQTQVVLLKVRAPPSMVARRPPIDLVTVLDVSDRVGIVRLQMMKRVMRMVISSLNSNDRLSIVAFSTNSKRLLPLRRMTADGRRSARRVVEALASTGQGMSASDALKKAAKVIEDRRVRNPVAGIIIISNGQDERSHNNQDHSSMVTVSSTRFSNLDIPVHTIGLVHTSASHHAPHEDSMVKSITGLLTFSVQDLKLKLGLVSSSSTQPVEISTVYSVTGRSSVFNSGSINLGDLHAEEERELLVELKVRSSIGAHPFISVQSSFKDPSSQEIILSKQQEFLLPRPQTIRSSLPNIQRLRHLHISTTAVVESRRLLDHNDVSGAYHLLSSARALLMQSSDGSANEHLRGLEAELGELNRRRQPIVQSQRQRSDQRQVEAKQEPLTPTSAWRAAERLAKIAIMRKHMNRVSDLHGFENARF